MRHVTEFRPFTPDADHIRCWYWCVSCDNPRPVSEPCYRALDVMSTAPYVLAEYLCGYCFKKASKEDA